MMGKKRNNRNRQSGHILYTHTKSIYVIGFYLKARIKGQEDKEEVKGRRRLKAIYSA